jgi:alpha-glucosidase
VSWLIIQATEGRTWFWKHSKDLRTAEARQLFLASCKELVWSALFDFFDHEAKEIIDLYQALLRTSASTR